MAEQAEVPIWGDELQYFIDVGTSGSPECHEATHLLSWEDDGDEQAYEPSYIDKRLPSKYVLGKTANISYEKDAFKNNDLDDFFIAHEEQTNIAVNVIRVYTWMEGTGGAGKYVAKQAPFLLSVNPLSKPNTGEPVKITGSLSMADSGSWETGTWDPSAKTFTKGE